MHDPQMRHIQQILNQPRTQRPEPVRPSQQHTKPHLLRDRKLRQWTIRLAKANPDRPKPFLNLKYLRTRLRRGRQARMRRNRNTLPRLGILPSVIGTNQAIRAALRRTSLYRSKRQLRPTMNTKIQPAMHGAILRPPKHQIPPKRAARHRGPERDFTRPPYRQPLRQ